MSIPRSLELNSHIGIQDVSMFQTATDEELSVLLHEHIEKMPDGPERDKIYRAFEKECNRRSREYYEKLNQGEWI